MNAASASTGSTTYKAGDIIEAYTQEKVKAILAAPTARAETATEAAQ